MPTEITWRTNLTVSNLHIAKALADQSPLIDPKLAEALSSPVRQFAVAIDAAGLPPSRFWKNLIPLAAKIGSRKQLLETAITKTIGRGKLFTEMVIHLSALLAAVEEALRLALPNHAEDLALREGPLRQQWEARGPGLLSHLGSLTEPELLPQCCEVLIAHPALGGAGDAHLNYNSVLIEGVLANPLPELPEVIRLAWLIAQLQLDLPAHSEHVLTNHLPHIAAFAMLPPILAAAEIVELARYSPELVSTAATAWRLASPPNIDAPTLVCQWWQTYQESRPPWNIALAALDQLFGCTPPVG